eukprot:GILJ01006861.1.p1 GENE.GILJ01006861.1~~GILJ01006861.1.p1  ORF type:complete len:302 (+),score=36.97 GILJ01006861.1:176-1081(+)
MSVRGQSNEHILVFGASGTVGKKLIDCFTRHHPNLRIRAVCKQAKMAAGTHHGLFEQNRNIECIEMELTRLESHSDLFRGIDRVFMLTPSRLDQPSIEGTICRLAAQHNVKHIVKLSVLGADLSAPSNSLLRWHALGEQLVMQCGVPYTILQPNCFMQNVEKMDWESVTKDGALIKPGDPKVSCIDCRDVAEAASVVLTESIDIHNGHTYCLTGPEGLKSSELASMLSKHLDRPIQFRKVDDFEYFNYLKSKNVSNEQILTLLKLHQFYRQGLAKHVAGDFKILTGKNPRHIEEYCSALRV